MLKCCLRADVDFDGGAWDRADAQDLECCAGGGLFALFDGAALAGGHLAAVSGDPGDKAGPVRRSLLRDHAIGRPQAVGLERLLKQGLPVAQLVCVHLGGVEDLIYGAKNQISIYKIRGPDYRLDRVGDNRVVYDGALDDLLESLCPADGGQERLADQVGPDSSELPLPKLGVGVEDKRGHAAVEDRVPAELQAAVGIIRVGDARVGE